MAILGPSGSSDIADMMRLDLIFGGMHIYACMHMQCLIKYTNKSKGKYFIFNKTVLLTDLRPEQTTHRSNKETYRTVIWCSKLCLAGKFGGSRDLPQKCNST